MFLGMSLNTCTKNTAGCIGYLYGLQYHIIACLNQVGSIVNYFSWRRFRKCFSMWHTIGLEHFKLKHYKIERLVNDEDVCVNQWNLDSMY